MNFQNPDTRRYLYGIAIAVIALAQAFRLIGSEHVDLVVNLVTAILGISSPALAIRNTPQGKHVAE